MNNKDEQIVQYMINYVEEKEREIQAEKTGQNSKTKVVSEIIAELERQIKNAD